MVLTRKSSKNNKWHVLEYANGDAAYLKVPWYHIKVL